ncbi:hypothetical protein ACFE04_007009 [Oxalis oulophora]
MALTDTHTNHSKSEAQSKTKRPICPSCTKPTSLCICNRIATLGLDNKVSVSVLQHKLETNHALNSARIARLGLKNVTLVTVCDVHYAAEFFIKFLHVGFDNGVEKCDFVDQVSGLKETRKPVFEDSDGFSFGKEEMCMKVSSLIEDNNGDRDGSVAEDFNAFGFGRQRVGQLGFVKGSDFLGDDYSDKLKLGFDQDKLVFSANGELPLISATIDKYGLNSDFDKILASEDGVQALSKGFIVKKIQKEQIGVDNPIQEHKEFEIEVPAGSVLLFPSDKSVSVDELKTMKFDVKNLIVLDGTWSKANRMYKENPWLKLLPHLKLDLDKTSLYSEVRQQPRPGCLSTIESIVYALKAVGDDPDCRLDNLLDVFGSMVEDQRRYRIQRLGRQGPIRLSTDG